MNLLSVENVAKYYGERILFEGQSFGINKGQKIAFIAKNGSGKKKNKGNTKKGKADT